MLPEMAFFNFFLDAFFRKIYGFRLCSKDMFIAELVNNSMFFKLLFYLFRGIVVNCFQLCNLGWFLP